MTAAVVARWGLARDPAVRVRQWEDEASALGFDERSGDTFVLGALALELMALLDECGALSEAELLARVSAGVPADPSVLPPAVTVELQRLRARGLISPLP